MLAEETLLSAARRVVRFFNIDNQSGGGLISTDTTQAVDTLDLQIRLETERQQQAAKDAEARAVKAYNDGL